MKIIQLVFEQESTGRYPCLWALCEDGNVYSLAIDEDDDDFNKGWIKCAHAIPRF